MPLIDLMAHHIDFMDPLVDFPYRFHGSPYRLSRNYMDPLLGGAWVPLGRTRFEAYWPHTWDYAYKPGPHPQAQAPEIGKKQKPKKKNVAGGHIFHFSFSGDRIWLRKKEKMERVASGQVFFFFIWARAITQKKRKMEDVASGHIFRFFCCFFSDLGSLGLWLRSRLVGISPCVRPIGHKSCSIHSLQTNYGALAPDPQRRSE